MKHLIGWAVLATVASLSAREASATIVTGAVTGGSAQGIGGTFVKLTVPLNNPFGPANSVGNNTFQSPNLYGFDEDQNILLAAPLVVDVGASPIAAGTTVASHYIFFDPAGQRTVTGTVTFDSTVLAIITSRQTLSASDFLANTGVNYLNPGARGLEPIDSAVISGLNEITVNFSASNPGDYIRVLTAYSPAAAVPEPSTLAGLAVGVVGAVGYGLRRRAGR